MPASSIVHDERMVCKDTAAEITAQHLEGVVQQYGKREFLVGDGGVMPSCLA
jgi:hypothetical protein